jgi:hypothetical protein
MKGPPTDKTPNECCQIPDIIPQSVFEKCEAANPRPPPPAHGMPPKGEYAVKAFIQLLQSFPPLGCCMSECVMNTTGIMVNGKLDKAAAVKYMTERLTGDAEAIRVATAAVDYCEKESNNKKSDFEEMSKIPVPAGEKVCNMMSGFMIGCVNGQVFKNCPKDKYGASAACDGIKGFVDKCGFLYPMKKGEVRG